MKQAVGKLRPVFSKEQQAEQKQFTEDLKNGTAKIAFEGTFKEGMDFLDDTGRLVNACIRT